MIAEVCRRVWHDLGDDNILGLAAQMSFFFALALFPFFILLAALVGTLPSTTLWDHVLKWITLYLPQTSQALVFQTVASLTRGREKFFSLGLVSAIWAATGGVLCLMSSMNIAYEVKETRKLWKRILLAPGMLFVLCFLFLGSFGLLTAGRLFAAWVTSHTGPISSLSEIWQVGRWIGSLILLIIGLALVENLLPDLKRPWQWITPGAALPIIAWIPGSVVFNWYVRDISSYNAMYGALAAFMVLMVWIYIVSAVILIEAEINCELLKIHTQGYGWLKSGAKSASGPAATD
ncbi:MAG: YihY/virulence factor BrkB family protein [Terriglobia bacterium]